MPIRPPVLVLRCCAECQLWVLAGVRLRLADLIEAIGTLRCVELLGFQVGTTSHHELGARTVALARHYRRASKDSS